jgi:3-oxoacyl-[acyl-carrier protein] reductase
MRFEGRVALVTGGGRGIGAATCRLLHRDGAAVAVCDVDVGPAEEVASEFGARGMALSCDVTSRPAVIAAVKAVAERFGRLDILVTCAGITRDNMVHKMTDEDWDGVIDTHLKGTFLCAQAAQSLMVPQRSGKMVFLSSTSALGNRGQANYSTAKAGLQGLARTLAIELGQFNINVNAVAPGFVSTRMTQATAERLGIEWETYKAERAKAIPLGRVGEVGDIASVIAFFASEESSFVSGQTLYARGGP